MRDNSPNQSKTTHMPSDFSTKIGNSATSKVLRNTYIMLALTLGTSAIAAMITMNMYISPMARMGMMFGSLALVWFVLPRTANSTAGIFVVFAFTTLLGAALGPVLNHYLAMANGGAIVSQALGATALVFFSLSGYVLVTGKDFTFLGGMLFTGLIIAIVAMLALFVAGGVFGINISGMHLGLSAMIAILMSGFILYDTSRIVNGGETNYLMATTSLYLNIYNLFVSLLHLIGFSND